MSCHMQKFESVLIRVDCNVPMQNGKIIDHSRIDAVLPEIAYWKSKAKRCILMSHLGRPQGEDSAFSLEAVASYLTKKLDSPVPLCRSIYEELPDVPVCMLENIRFYTDEYADDSAFSKHLAKLADHFVYDAFSVAHRRHASCHEIFKHVRSYGFGQLYQEEIAALEKISDATLKRAFLIGGAKTETKIKLLKHLLELADDIFIGGVIGHTFLAAQGVDMTGAKYDQDSVPLARQILDDAKRQGVRIHLPIDAVSDQGEVVSFGQGQALFDIGPQTLQNWQKHLRGCEQIVWNGPLGYYEDERFVASRQMADFLAKQSSSVMIGGGDTLAVITNPGEFDHVSTGGGAFLYYLEKQRFPHTELLK